MVRRLIAELVGTFFLVFFAVGVATLMFGFRFDGGSVAAGTALSQVWLFIVAPLVGGAVAAVLHRIVYPTPAPEPVLTLDPQADAT